MVIHRSRGSGLSVLQSVMRVRSNITCVRRKGRRYCLVLHAVGGEGAFVDVVASHLERHVHRVGVGKGVWVREGRRRGGTGVGFEQFGLVLVFGIVVDGED